MNLQNRSLTDLYEDLIELDDEIKEWLEVEPKEKWALSYDFGGRRYGNMTTNFSDIIIFERVSVGCLLRLLCR